ncbi:RNA ligase [Archaeoglobales archaeon]|nr:MAG: RNA ligase [Archaeoglobales archaeon]
MKFVAEVLKLSKSAAIRLEERRVLRQALIKHPFFPDLLDAYKLDKKFGEYEEGTLIVKTKDGYDLVRGYPKIRRALTLYPTLIKHFKEGDVVVEEKMNGYNVRIVHFGNNVYAITRRGYICPYTTEKARKLVPFDFFKDNPDLMLCCEAVGEESPFVSKSVYGIKNLDFFVFGVRQRRTNKALPVKIKERLVDEYSLKMSPILDVVDVRMAHEKIIEIVKELGSEGREGVVIKDGEMLKNPIKYTASQSNCSDLSFAFRFFNEYGRNFMFSRIIREGFQSFEFCEDEDELTERCRRLGEAILKPMIDSIKEVSEGKKVVERNRLRFDSLEVFELFKKHVKKMGFEAAFSNPVEEDGSFVVYFDRIMRSTTDKISTHLGGDLW